MPVSLKSLGVTNVELLYVGQETASNTRNLSAAMSLFEEAGLKTQIHTLDGSPALSIVEQSGQLQCDLIAFCWKPKSWLQKTLTGSTTLDVIRLCDKPVFVLKQPIEGPILYATNFHAADAAVISLLNSQTLRHSPIHLLHVGERAPDPLAEHRRKETVERELQRLASECAAPVSVTMSEGSNVSRAITSAAATRGSTLIVLGKSKERGSSSVLGSTAERLAYTARSSVLIVPPEEQTTAPEKEVR